MLKSNGSPPLLHTTRVIPGPNGEAVGTICTDLAEVDANVKHSYSSIYAGNIIGSPSAHAASFISKHFPFIFNGPVFNVPPLPVLTSKRNVPRVLIRLEVWMAGPPRIFLFSP